MQSFEAIQAFDCLAKLDQHDCKLAKGLLL